MIDDVFMLSFGVVCSVLMAYNNCMADFDISGDWVILASLSCRTAAEELAMYIGLLREKANLKSKQIKILEANAAAPADHVIILNNFNGNADKRGFNWRVRETRIEIFGDSARGLWNGIFDFLGVLGIKWPNPDNEELPSCSTGTVYTLKTEHASCPSVSQVADQAAPEGLVAGHAVRERRRFFIREKVKEKDLGKLIKWAAHNKYDALVFSLGRKSFWDTIGIGNNSANIEKYNIIIEAGGSDLSLLLPRHLFLFHKDLFRMESGKRTSNSYFCPTNPKTGAHVADQAAKLFSRAAPGMTEPNVFHLLPDKEYEKRWCSCPACRAFAPFEQYMIACNTAADALADINSKAILMYSCFSDSQNQESGGIVPRKNMLPVAIS